MSHELSIREGGKVEMAYVEGVQPWHGLGTPVTKGATIDEWVMAAGMEWNINSSPIEYVFGDEMISINDRRVLHRSDTGAALGVVSKDYKEVQPRETVEFFRDLIEAVGLEMVTAGTLFGGKRFWATAYIGEDALLDNRDPVRGYLLISTSADGSLATTARFTSVRVVCNNTLRMAHSDNQPSVRIVHSKAFNPAEVKKTLGVAPKSFETFMDSMRKLARHEITGDRAMTLTTELLDTDSGPVHKKILELFNGDAIGHDLPGFADTTWGWLNSVTEFVDHERRGKSDSHRLSSSLFGRGDAMKVRALELALEEVG